MDTCIAAFYPLQQNVSSAIMQNSNSMYPGIDKTVPGTCKFAVMSQVPMTVYPIVDCHLCSERLDEY